MRVGITGATGFIGSYTARALAGDGHEVVALLRQGKGPQTRSTAFGDPSRQELLEGVLADRVFGRFQDPDAQRKLCDGADCIIHLAVDWGALRASHQADFTVNVLGSLSLLEAARVAGVRQFIFFSSISVYHEILQDRKLDEAHPTWPDSHYGAAKAAVEPFLKTYFLEHGMNTVSLRPGAVYGLDPVLDRSAWFSLVGKVRRGESIDTARGGKIVSVGDCVEAVRRCLGNDAVAGSFYVLVDSYLYDQEVAEMAREICGSASEIADRKGHGPKNQFDVSAARKLGVPLSRGRGGVEEYLEELIEAMK